MSWNQRSVTWFFCILAGLFPQIPSLASAADAPLGSGTTAVVIDPASSRLAMLKHLHLAVTSVDDVLPALDASKYRLTIIDATPANLLALQQHPKELDQFTAAGGWVMLWGVTPNGLATFDKLVGVDHIMRPFRMEKVATAAIPTLLSAGMVSSDFHMETNKRTPEPVSVNFLAEDAWTYVVDLDDIAPFCQFPPAAYWDAGWATIGTDRWPDNMICGIDDNWRFSFTIPISKPKYTDWTITLPRKESIDGFSLERETLFNRITKVHLSFPGTDAKPVDLDVTQDARQDFDFPPLTADRVQVALELDGKNKLATGIRNLRLKIQRSADFDAHVKPLASIGVLVAYPRGTGGIVLNELNVPAVEAASANEAKKRNLLGALLRNLHAPFAPGTPIPLRRVEWLQKGTAWEDPANWSDNAVPGIGDIACFPAAFNSVATVNPVISKPAEVGGLEFDNDYGGPAEAAGHSLAPGVKSLGQHAPSWVVSGRGTLSIGTAGVFVTGHVGSDVIACDVRLIASQTWRIGVPGWAPNILLVDPYGNPFNLVLTGNLSGTGPWIKDGGGRLYYANNTPPTFTGGLIVRGTTVEWALNKLSGPGTFQFGPDPITLDGGFFCFGAYNTPTKDTVELTNPIFVTPRNGMLELAVEAYGKPPVKPPLVRYSGAVHLAGNLKVAHNTLGGGESGEDLVGPIFLDRSVPATPGLAMGDFVSGWDVYPIIRGDIHDGPGAADNPMVFRSLIDPFVICGTHTDYGGDTIIDDGGSRLFNAASMATVVAAPGVTLGKGNVYLQPGGHLNLSDSSNIAADKSVDLASDAANLSVLGLGYNGIPAISKKSTGVIAIETNNFDAIADLSKLGDGTMRLGSMNGGSFTGKSLAPGAGNLYRLGGGGGNRATDATPFVIAQPVLVDSAGVEVGSTAWWGNSNLVLAGANTFAGPLLVQGPATPSQYSAYLTSVLEGIAQTAPGASPFGSPQGPASLSAAVLQLTGVAGGQPVSKGILTFDGHSEILLNGGRGPADLTFSDLHRNGNAILTVESSGGRALGTTERLHINSWNKPLPIVDPYLLCYRGNGVDFLSYDPVTGIVPFTGYVKDLTKSQPDDVLLLGATTLKGQTIHAKDLKATGPITGNGTFVLSGGGLLATGNVSANLDFGDAEGVIFSPCNLLGKVSGNHGLTFATRMFGYREVSLLYNAANDFTGPITVNSTVLQARFDSRTPDGKDVCGSFGNLTNPIVLNGGFLTHVDAGTECELAATRTITLGPSGGGFYFGYQSPSQTHIRAKITGPGMLTQFIEDIPSMIIDNPNNDYAGGTKVCAGLNTGMIAGPLGKLGTGPVQIDPESQLILQGDNNVDPHARLEVALGGIARCNSSAPRFGSLSGAGAIYFDGRSNSSLTVGSDDSNFTFYGTIIEEGNIQGSLTKVGAGTWKLFGSQRFSGLTTVSAGTFDLRGALAGGIVVAGPGTLCANGTVVGDVEFQPHSTLDILGDATGLQIAGKATLDPNVDIYFASSASPVAGAHLTVLAAKGGIIGDLPAAPKGYQFVLAPDRTSLEIIKQ